ncbi:MAG: bifunctional phosphopantothenoylcysteine decarboxylase/phosphopantothenate--cysteine ligase CoaBC [Gammaproteobacteria bacterium]|nr:bifunctional phosphopantothenoylcysteine decarboxylase/phosphopantothenate--cysteine ligase CoaBC [Gammaproteobacteria bacterium]
MIRSAGTAAPRRRLLLGVTGGIAAYKAAELARRLVGAGAEVQVVMTAAAERFVAAATFQALCGRPVRNDLWDAQAEAGMGHIELARWPEAIVVAPASADFIARLSVGLADDLLTTLCLASDRPLWLAPAMNRLMWAHPATQANVERLRRRGVRLIGPDAGEQACGEVGPGRMVEAETIAAAVLACAPAARPLAGVKAVVTAGPTREAIDPVRFIGNHSSGKQGFAVAAALAEAGAWVTLIAGPVALPTPPAVERVDVETAEQMLTATLSACAGARLLVGAAAVADYRPARPSARKIKKSTAALTLELVLNPDLLSAARARDPRLFIVGFAAETEAPEANARAKLAAKRLDLIAANRVGAGLAFDRDDNALTVLWADGQTALGPAPKPQLARELVSLIVDRLGRCGDAA